MKSKLIRSLAAALVCIFMLASVLTAATAATSPSDSMNDVYNYTL